MGVPDRHIGDGHRGVGVALWEPFRCSQCRMRPAGSADRRLSISNALNRSERRWSDRLLVSYLWIFCNTSGV